MSVETMMTPLTLSIDAPLQRSVVQHSAADANPSSSISEAADSHSLREFVEQARVTTPLTTIFWNMQYDHMNILLWEASEIWICIGYGCLRTHVQNQHRAIEKNNQKANVMPFSNMQIDKAYVEDFYFSCWELEIIWSIWIMHNHLGSYKYPEHYMEWFRAIDVNRILLMKRRCVWYNLCPNACIG